MTSLDWAVFAFYSGAVVLIGIIVSRKSVGVEGFFLGNRRLGWGAIGLSVMATQASAITFIGTTGQSYENGMEFIQIYLPQPLVMVVLCVTFVPFFYRSKVFTAYEFLEKRFDAKTRSLTSFLFLLSRGLAAGIVLYAPAVVLSVIMGWDETVTVLIIGAITILYTVVGGIAAVIWTDVAQMLIMFIGIGVALVTLFSELPEQVQPADIVYIGGIQEMWKSIDLSWDPSNRYTLWTGLIGGFFLALSYFGCDQSQVQRYLTAKSLRQSRLALIFNAFLKVPMQFFILIIGVLLFVFFHFERPPLIFNPAETAALASSSRRSDFQQLENRYLRAHELRKEATFELLRSRREGRDTGLSHHKIRQQDQRLSELRRQAKALVEQVRGASSNDVNYVFPSYLVRYVPPGFLGLMIAVIFAAAMSSLDSELTALASATVMDFYRRYWMRQASSGHYLWVSRLATLLWG
ncbi:MAG: sodium:solute symporter, partial [Acidobacteriota bacterium]